jgi:hypothetical protein
MDEETLRDEMKAEILQEEIQSMKEKDERIWIEDNIDYLMELFLEDNKEFNDFCKEQYWKMKDE